MSAKLLEAQSLHEPPPSLVMPVLSHVFSWSALTSDEEFAPGTLLRGTEEKGGYRYAGIVNNHNGLLNCFRPDELFTTDDGQFLYPRDNVIWEVYNGDRLPDLSRDLSDRELIERAIIIFMHGRLDAYNAADLAALEMMLGDPSIDDTPKEPEWRKIARSIWLDFGKCEVCAGVVAGQR